MSFAVPVPFSILPSHASRPASRLKYHFSYCRCFGAWRHSFSQILNRADVVDCRPETHCQREEAVALWLSGGREPFFKALRQWHAGARERQYRYTEGNVFHYFIFKFTPPPGIHTHTHFCYFEANGIRYRQRESRATLFLERPSTQRDRERAPVNRRSCLFVEGKTKSHHLISTEAP